MVAKSRGTSGSELIFVSVENATSDGTKYHRVENV